METWATKPGPKKLFTGEGAVDELIDNHEAAGGQVFLKRAAGGDGDHIGDPCAFQRVDIGAVIDGAGRLDVAATVPRQEDQIDALEGAEQQLIRRSAPWAFDPLPAGIFEAGNIVDAAAAYDAEDCFGHGNLRAFGRVLAWARRVASKRLDEEALRWWVCAHE